MRLQFVSTLKHTLGKHALVPGLLVCLSAGCVSQADPVANYDPALIDGAGLFGQTIAPAPEQEILTVSSAMRAFLVPDISAPGFDVTRFQRLMKKLKREGFFKDRYDGDATYSAADTFAARRGNCMGYTNMFVALAREVGLDAKFQLVENRPRWEVEGEYLVRNNHINVLIDSVSVPGRTATTIEVDFNLVQQGARNRATSKIITDAYANSLFYANLAMDDFHAGNLQGAFSLLKRAVLTAPKNKGLWSNLGVLYLARNKPVMAEQAYAQALEIDSYDKTALTGMVAALRSQARTDEAEVLAKRLKRYHAKRQRRVAAETQDTAYATGS